MLCTHSSGPFLEGDTEQIVGFCHFPHLFLEKGHEELRFGTIRIVESI